MTDKMRSFLNIIIPPNSVEVLLRDKVSQAVARATIQSRTTSIQKHALSVGKNASAGELDPVVVDT